MIMNPREMAEDLIKRTYEIAEAMILRARQQGQHAVACAVDLRSELGYRTAATLNACVK